MDYYISNYKIYELIPCIFNPINFYFQEVALPKNQGSLGFSIIGGSDHSCIPFDSQNPGIFISHVIN